MGKGSKKAKTPYEAPDNLKSHQCLRIIDMWGEGQIKGLVGDRFIPMCIGNTRIKAPFPLSLTVYPYVYREHIPERASNVSSCGLSLCV